MVFLKRLVSVVRTHLPMTALAVTVLTGGLAGCSTIVAPIVGGTIVTGVAIGNDRRPIGSYVSDQTMVFAVATKLNKNIPDGHINVTSFNRTLLLTGEVLDVAAHAKADEIARNHPEVRKVFNYLQIGPAASWNSRANDTWVTTKVRLNLIAGKGYPSNQIKIVTERGIVYVMGLLNDQEVAVAASVVSKTIGVQEVVTLTEAYVPWEGK